MSNFVKFDEKRVEFLEKLWRLGIEEGDDPEELTLPLR